MRRVLLSCTGALAIAITSASPAVAATGNLPGGTSIGVTIDSPADGAVRPPGPVDVTGSASIGQGTPVANTALVYVLDVSGSTDEAGAPGCGGDANGDGRANRVMDCEIAAARTLNGQAVSIGTVGDVGAAVFGETAASADVRPAGGDQHITGPATDDNGAGGRDIEQVLASTHSSVTGDGGVSLFTAKSVGGSTNFADGVSAATTVAAASNKQRKVVVFLSDGIANAGGPVSGPLASVPSDVDIYTFAVGAGSSCTNTGGGRGSLQQIATATGGTCTQVDDAAQLPDILPGVIASKLVDLTLSVDGGAPSAIGSVTPGLPQDGPATVDYSTTTAALGPGTHTVCVTANGTDGGGGGHVTECHDVIINAPPTVDAGGPYAGQEGTAVSLGGTVTDPDSPGVTSAWTIAPQSGVDSGATCAFSDASNVGSTVTCTDDGTYALTLTGDDGVNPPVARQTTLTLTNVAPHVTISAPANGTLATRGTVVAFTAPFTDIGTNDTHTCTLDFADGGAVAPGSVSETPGSGTCTAAHAFTHVGPHAVLVTVTDDDGDSATAVVTVVVYLKGEAFALAASGPVTIAKTPLATCPPNETKTVASVNLGIASTGALNASCTLDPATGRTDAAASVDHASLLGGLITIGAVQSHCVADAGGITGSSTVATINGRPIGSGSGSLGIPGVAQVFYNETTTGPNGQLVQNAIRVHTLLGQDIILAGCRLG